MNKTVACKLTPTPEQQAALLETLDLFAGACNAALNTQATIGVDLGINRVATTSTKGPISGKKLNRKREKMSRVRASLQTKGTQGAKRALKRPRRKESRYQADVNHCISKQIIEEAKATNKAIVLEDLSGIRKRGNNKGKRMRRMLGRWAFYQLRAFKPPDLSGGN